MICPHAAPAFLMPIAIFGFLLLCFLVVRRIFVRDVSSSKAEQQVASEARSGCLYSREGGPTGSCGRQGTSGAAEARKVPGGQWIITRWGQDEFFSSPTDQLLPPLYIPNHSPTASEQLTEVRAYNGQQVTRRTMCRKCRKNARLVHNGRNTQE